MKSNLARRQLLRWLGLGAAATLSCCMPASLASPTAVPPATRPQSSAATTHPLSPSSNGRNQAPRTPQQRNTPAPRQTPQDRGGSDAGQNQSLEMPPHPVDVILGQPTPHSITASILMYQDGEGYIEYGTESSVHSTSKTTLHAFSQGSPGEIVLDGLAPNSRYYYQVFYRLGKSGAFTPLPAKSFYTQRTPDSAFTFDIQADSHLDSNSSMDVYARSLANELADKPDFLIDLGDTFMTDKYQPYTVAQKQYVAQRYFLGVLAPSPLFLVPGNHDGESAAGEMTAWSEKLRTQYFPNPTPNGLYSGSTAQDYYAWEWGDALFVVLDPYRFTPPVRAASDNWIRTLGETQYQWLKKTLEMSCSKWKFVFIHQLVGGLDRNGRGGAEAARLYEWGGYDSNGSYAFAAQRPGWTMPIHPLLVANRVTAVFHGHDHLFVKQELDGIIYQEVPQPSAARYDQTSNAKEYGYTTGDVLPSSGHLRVTVSASKVAVDYVRAYPPQDENPQRKNGQIDYTYTVTAR